MSLRVTACIHIHRHTPVNSRFENPPRTLKRLRAFLHGGTPWFSLLVLGSASSVRQGTFTCWHGRSDLLGLFGISPCPTFDNCWPLSHLQSETYLCSSRETEPCCILKVEISFWTSSLYFCEFWDSSPYTILHTYTTIFHSGVLKVLINIFSLIFTALLNKVASEMGSIFIGRKSRSPVVDLEWEFGWKAELNRLSSHCPTCSFTALTTAICCGYWNPLGSTSCKNILLQTLWVAHFLFRWRGEVGLLRGCDGRPQVGGMFFRLILIQNTVFWNTFIYSSQVPGAECYTFEMKAEVTPLLCALAPPQSWLNMIHSPTAACSGRASCLTQAVLGCNFLTWSQGHFCL